MTGAPPESLSDPEPEHGIDLSRRTTVDDWRAVRAAHVAFASVTVTESANWADPIAERYIHAAQDAGIHTGARHYARPGGVADQAAHFVRVAGRLGALSPGSLAPALLVGAEGVDDRFIRGWIRAMRHAARIQRVLVYAELEHWERRLHPDRWADAEVTLWLVRHNGIPGRPGWFHSRLGLHQYGAGAGVPGIRDRVGQDALVYPFTAADLLL